MTNRLPLIVNPEQSQIQELGTGDNLVLPTGSNIELTGNITPGAILTDGYYYANGQPFSGGGSVDLLHVATDVIPSGNVTQSLGNATNQWSSLWVAGDTIYMDSVPVSLVDGNLQVAGDNVIVASPQGDIATTGNVSGAYILGDGSLLTNLPAGNYSNANVAAYLADTDIPITTTDNVTANFFIGDGSQLTNLPLGDYSNANVAAYLPTYTGNVGADTITVSGMLTTTGASPAPYINGFQFSNIVGNLTTAGNISGSYILGNGSQLTGLPIQPGTYGNANVSAYLASGTDTANIITTGNVTANAFITGNMTIQSSVITSSGDVITIDPYANGSQGNVIVQGNLDVRGTTTTINSQTVSINDLVFNVANNASSSTQANGGGIGVGPVGAEYATLLYGSTLDNWNMNIPLSVEGNIETTANVLVSGNVEANVGLFNDVNLNNQATNSILYTDSLRNITSTDFSYDAGTQTISGSNISASGTVAATTLVGDGGNIANINGANVTGIVAEAAQANTANVATIAYSVDAANVSGIVAEAEQSNTANSATTAATAYAVAGGNVSGQVANALVAGTVYTNAQPNITSVGTLTSLDVTGNVATGNILTDGYFYANGTPISFGGDYGNANVADYLASGTVTTDITTTGNITAAYLAGDGSNITNINGSNVTGQVGNALVAGTVYTNAQPNITSVGTLTSLGVTGNISGANITGTYLYGDGSNITGGYGNANVSAYLPTIENDGNVVVFVDPVYGNDAYSGSELGPKQTISNAIATLNGQPGVVRLAPGTYTENWTYSGANSVSFVGSGYGSQVNLTGNVEFAHTAGSCDLTGANVANLTYSGSAGTELYLFQDYYGNLTHTSAGELSMETCIQVGTGNLLAAGSNIVINTSTVGNMIVSNANAFVQVYSSRGAPVGNTGWDLQSGILGITNSSFFIPVGANAITVASGAAPIPGIAPALSITNTSIIDSDNSAGNICIGTNAFWAVSGVSFDNANSVITSPYNIDTVWKYDSALFYRNITVGTVNNATGNIKYTGSLLGTGTGNNVFGGPISVPTLTASTGINTPTATISTLANITGATAATSTTTGSLKTAGGLGVVGNAWIGGNLNVANITGINRVANGTSNISIATANGNLAFNVGGGNVGFLSATSVALGSGAAVTGQGAYSVAIGASAANLNQSTNSVAVGPYAGQTNQSTLAVAVGFYAGGNAQSTNGIAIGRAAGSNIQGAQSIAIGWQAGYTSQNANSISIGANAAYNNQGISCIAIGGNAAFSNQGPNAIAIGTQAGNSAQGNNAVAIGTLTGNTAQGANSIAIGYNAGYQNQGTGAIAIGTYAGYQNQTANSIVLNATGINLNGGNQGLYITPVRNDTGNITNSVYYNTSTKEITYATTVASSNVAQGVDVTLDNFRVRLSATGNVNLQIAAVSGSASLVGTTTWTTGGAVSVFNPTTFSATGTAQSPAPGANLTGAGDTQTYTFQSGSVAYRATVIAGVGYTSNTIIIERLL